MLYDQNAIKRLLKSIGMGNPIGYLIENERAPEVYRGLRWARRNYGVVAEVMHDILTSDDFRRRGKPDSYFHISTVDMRDNPYRRHFMPEDIEIFESMYGIGREKETVGAISKRIGISEKDIVNLSKQVKQILISGKNKQRPGEYRAQIWRSVYKRLTSG